MTRPLAGRFHSPGNASVGACDLLESLFRFLSLEMRALLEPVGMPALGQVSVSSFYLGDWSFGFEPQRVEVFRCRLF